MSLKDETWELDALVVNWSDVELAVKQLKEKKLNKLKFLMKYWD